MMEKKCDNGVEVGSLFSVCWPSYFPFLWVKYLLFVDVQSEIRHSTHPFSFSNTLPGTCGQHLSDLSKVPPS